MATGKYFDDLSIGDVFETGGITLTQGAIIDFALVHDPQPFHVDAVAASDSIFGGIVASGFQTVALTFRLFYNTGVLTGTNLGGHGMDELARRWLDRETIKFSDVAGTGKKQKSFDAKPKRPPTSDDERRIQSHAVKRY